MVNTLWTGTAFGAALLLSLLGLEFEPHLQPPHGHNQQPKHLVALLPQPYLRKGCSYETAARAFETPARAWE